MKFENCSEVDRGLWQYIDRELSAADLALLSTHLKGCQRCRDLFHERAREANLYRTILMGSPFGDGFVEKLMGRMRQDGLLEGEWCEPRTPRHRQRPSHEHLAAAGEWEAVPHSRQRTWRRLAVLSLVLVIPVAAITGILIHRSGERVLGTFEVARGSMQVALQNAEEQWDPPSGPVTQGELLAGSSLHLPEGAQASLHLAAADPARAESVLTLDGPAELRLDAGATRGELLAVLRKGGLHAKVSKRLPGESFAIFTPQSRAAVVGTTFRLDVDAERTTLMVLEGEVRFEALNETAAGPGGISVTASSGAHYLQIGMAAPAAVAVATGKDPPVENEAAAAPLPPAAGPGTDAASPGATGSSSAGEHLDTPVSGAERKDR